MIVGNLYYIDHFAKDVLIFAKYDDQKISNRDSLPKFSIIDLYLGNGFETEVLVPNLIGLSLKDVKQKLNNFSLNVGSVNLEVNDSLSSIVYKQVPEFNEKLTLGSFVSVWFRSKS